MKAYLTRQEQFSIIVYGISGTFAASKDYLQMRFNIMGYSDRDESKAKLAEVDNVKYYRPNELKEAEFDYIVITSDYDEEICRDLTERVGIDRKKILKRSEWNRMIFHYSYGEKNPDKTFYVMAKGLRLRNGLLSIAFSFVEQIKYVEQKGYIPIVDMQNYANQYIEIDKFGKENAWEYYYEQMSEYSLDEVYSSKNVVLGYDDACYLDNYKEKYNISIFQKYWKEYVVAKPHVKNWIDIQVANILGDKCEILGVLYRGTDMNLLKLSKHPIQPTVEEMIELIHEHIDKWNCKWIYLSTEDSAAMEKFKNEFGDSLICTDQQRFSNTGNKWIAQIEHKRENDKYLRGIEYLTTIELLSRCDYLLAGICSGSVVSLIMNDGKYKDVYMVDKGSY